jgi:hypothetical protein
MASLLRSGTPYLNALHMNQDEAPAGREVTPLYAGYSCYMLLRSRWLPDA